MIFYIIFAKIIQSIVTVFRLGSGNTLPGYLTLKIYPAIAGDLSKNYKKFILISGTNGKTTTTKLITHFLNASGYTVLTNSSGSNLLRGIVTSLLLDLDLSEKPKSNICVFEVDELNLPIILQYVHPTQLLLLNLSRDQLDRYGEVDVIFDRWLAAIKDLNTKLIYDSDQPEFKAFKSTNNSVITFDDAILFKGYPLKGSFNARNINAAMVSCTALGVETPVIQKALETFNPAYGRGEELIYKNNKFKILLAKNPASFNHNLDLVLESSPTQDFDEVFILLNDKIPDGRDVSWIYDVSFNKLKNAFQDISVYVSGTRSLDMAVRLQYAGVSVLPENVSDSMQHILSVISKKSDRRILVMPNYSAMLEVRELLLGRRIL